MIGVTGFGVMFSSDDIEESIVNSVMFGSSPVRELLIGSSLSPSEYILTEVFGFTLEYTVEFEGVCKSFYTISGDDWTAHWSFYMNLFYGAGVNFVGFNNFVAGMNVWFDIQGKVGRKGWLMKADGGGGIEKLSSVLSDVDKMLLGLNGFDFKLIQPLTV